MKTKTEMKVIINNNQTNTNILMMFLIIFGLNFINFVPLKSHAGILLEPYFALENGVMNATASTALGSLDYSQKSQGTGLGMRVGYTLPILFWSAIDYSLQNGTLSAYGSSSVSNDYNRTMLFVDVGFDFPILIRGWLGYGISDKLVSKEPGADKTFSGTATKIGVGFTGLPFLSINLEYITHQFNEVNSAAYTSGTNVSTYYGDLKPTSILVSVSAPFNL